MSASELASLSLIPPARFGALLVSKRRETGADIVDVARRSKGRVAPSLLSRIERGRVALDDLTVSEIVDLYELDSSPVIPERSRLVLDLDQNQMGVGGRQVPVENATVDHVLGRYLSLLYLLRDMKPGGTLALRDPDLIVLSETLEVELSRLERRLGELMLAPATLRGARDLRQRLILPIAGLLVAATGAGSLVLVSGAEVFATRLVEPPSALIVESPSEVMTASFGGPAATVEQSSSPMAIAAALPDHVEVPAADGAVDAGSLDADPDTRRLAIASAPSIPIEEVVGAEPLAPAADSASADPTRQSNPEPSPQVESSLAIVESAPPGPEAEPPENPSVATAPPDAPEPPPSALLPSSPTGKPALAAPLTAMEQAPETEPVPVAYRSPDTLGAAALAEIAYDWESVLPGWTVGFQGPMSGVRGMTNVPTKTIAVSVRDADNVADVAEVLAHELGHAIDVTYLTNDDRGRWLDARGMPKVWWAGSGLNDFSVGAGDFAEAVAALWVGAPSLSAHGPFTAGQLELAAELLP